MSYIGTRDYLLEVAKGNIDGDVDKSQFGWNQDVDTGSSPEIIGAFGGTWVPPVAGVATFSSSSTTDTLGGTGANFILVEGVDSSGNLASEVIQMNGLLSVVSTTSWRGINRAAVAVAGSSEFNDGDITGTIGTTQVYIPSQKSISQQLIFFVPDTHNAYITRIVLECEKTSGGSSPEVICSGFYNSGGVTYNILETVLRADTRPEFNSEITIPVEIPAGSYWWATADTDTNNTFVRGRVEQLISEI